MTEFIDSQGKSHKLITAERDVVVMDPELGFERQILAGDPVPPELRENYEKAIAGESNAAAEPDPAVTESRARTSRSRGSKASTEPAADDK